MKLEQHLDVAEQKWLAAQLKKYFGEKLYIPPVENGDVLPEPCPAIFKDRILISVRAICISALSTLTFIPKIPYSLQGKKLSAQCKDDVGETSDDDESIEGTRRPKKGHGHPRVRLTRDLSDLTSPFLVSTHDINSASRESLFRFI